MIRLVTHLEHLLRIHDCVIVPQLGGFVLQVVAASYVEEDHLFRPMHKEVVFNANLRHNDGLLSERYMQAFGVSFQRANRMLEEDVAMILDELQKTLTVSLGAVGSFSLGVEGQVVFKTGNPEIFSVDSYGLAPFHLKTWELLQQDAPLPNTSKHTPKTFYLPVNRRVLRIVTASAAAIALFFLISTPVKEVNQESYKASFIPMPVDLSSHAPADDFSFEEDEDGLTPEEFGAFSMEEDVNTGNSGQDTQDTAHSKPAPAYETTTPALVKETPKPAVKETETYYIIIASVGSRKQADDFIAYKVDFGAMPNTNTLVTGNQIRVYADKFTDKSSADAYLAKVKDNSKFPDAWMFTQKK
ncbi:cell division protein [Bacteroidia bacterium]|nr:cell division protein [Bacteroidia bacterium]